MNGADPKTKASKIQQLVADGDLDEATKQLIIFAEDFSPKKELIRESISLSSEYHFLSGQLRREGPTDFIYLQLKRVRIHILELVDVITDEFNQANIDLITESRASSLQLYSSSQINNRPSKKIDEENQKIERGELADKIWKQKKATYPTSIVFEGTGISKIYKSKVIKFTLHPIDLRLKLGEITAVVGENASGKTTLLRVVAGELASSSGELRYPYLTLNGKTDWYSIKQQIAYIPQALPYWNGLLLDNLHFTASIHEITGQDNIDAVNGIISLLRLDEYRKATWNEISGAYKTRFALAKAMVGKPKLVILDEPLGNLDINAQGIFLRDLENLKSSSTYPMSIIVSSQHLYELESIAENIVFLKDGEAIYSGLVTEFDESRKFKISSSVVNQTDFIIDIVSLETVRKNLALSYVNTINAIKKNEVKSHWKDLNNETLNFFQKDPWQALRYNLYHPEMFHPRAHFTLFYGVGKNYPLYTLFKEYKEYFDDSTFKALMILDDSLLLELQEILKSYPPTEIKNVLQPLDNIVNSIKKDDYQKIFDILTNYEGIQIDNKDKAIKSLLSLSIPLSKSDLSEDDYQKKIWKPISNIKSSKYDYLNLTINYKLIFLPSNLLLLLYTFPALVIIYSPLFLFLSNHSEIGKNLSLIMFFGGFLLWELNLNLIESVFLIKPIFLAQKNQPPSLLESYSLNLFLLTLTTIITWIVLSQLVEQKYKYSGERELFLVILPFILIFCFYGLLLNLCMVWLIKINIVPFPFKSVVDCQVFLNTLLALAGLSYLLIIPYLKSQFIQLLSLPRD